MLCEAENIKSSHPSASAKNKAAGRFRDRLFLASRPEKSENQIIIKSTPDFARKMYNGV